MLFNLKDLSQKETAALMASHEEKCAKYISEEIESDLATAIGELKDNTSYHFNTDTSWNLHDIIVYFIKQVGMCSFYFSTYAIKEYQARLFTNMKSEGLITQLHALLDYRTPVHDKEAVQLLEENATSIGFMRTHSKLSVIISEKISITITGSANLTTNTNADTGVITIHQEISEARKNWILKKINDNATHN